MNGEFHIAVCDDIRIDREQIAGMTAQILNDEELLHSISCYESAGAVLTDIQKGAEFDLLILDVLMDEMDGMELAAQLRTLRDQTPIIFISVSCEMALRGYEVCAARYFAKPLSEGKLKEACPSRRSSTTTSSSVWVLTRLLICPTWV